MSNVLPDGSVIPSNFEQGPMSSAVKQIHSNTVLHVGMVINVIYPDNDRSITQVAHEYDVAITNMDRENGLNVSVYRNCRMSDRFAAPNNSEVATLVPGVPDGKGGYKQGSIVVLECLGGNSDAGMAVIVGGLFNSVVASYKESDGQVYEFLFNGLRQKINKDGEWIIEFNSYIDVEGKKANEKAAGTALSIDKDGKFKLTDNEGQAIMLDRVGKTATWTNGADSITIDKGNKKIAMVSSGEMSQSSQKAMSMDSSDALNVSSKQDTSVKSGANLNMESTGSFQSKSSGKMSNQSSGDWTVTAGGNVMIQGGAMAQLQAAITMLGAGSVPAAGVGISTCLGLGNLGLPVVSTILVGSSTVFIGT